MKNRDDWIRDLERRQDNIDPIRRIPNSAFFQGTLINGNLRLNPVQRAGALLLGVCGLAAGFFSVASVVIELRAQHFPDLAYMIFAPFSLWLGWKLTKNAFVNDPTKARRHG